MRIYRCNLCNETADVHIIQSYTTTIGMKVIFWEYKKFCAICSSKLEKRRSKITARRQKKQEEKGKTEK